MGKPLGIDTDPCSDCVSSPARYGNLDSVTQVNAFTNLEEIMEEIIDIHPLDLGDLLNSMEEPELTLLKESKWHGEVVEVAGKKYRQTVDVPVTSEYGKKFLSELNS